MTVTAEIIVPVLCFLAFVVAVGFLVNKYTPLMGFRGTALCVGTLLTAVVLQLAFNEPTLYFLGEYARRNTAMFRVTASLVGLAVFLIMALIFERNDAKLEERLKSKQPAVAVQAPSGLTADEIAAAVAKRLGLPPVGVLIAGSEKQAPSGATPTPALTAPTLAHRVAMRASEILPKLTALTAEAEGIFQTIIGDPEQVEHFPRYQRQIEDWRTRVGRTYEGELPNSGARELVLPKTGVVGGGPIAFELSRLVNAIEAQKKVIDNLEKYVRRSLSFAEERPIGKGVAIGEPK